MLKWFVCLQLSSVLLSYIFLGANYLTKAFVIQVGLVDKIKAMCDFRRVLIFAAIGLLIFRLRIVNLIIEYVILWVMMIGY